MNSRGHFYVSSAKSFLRILSCIYSILKKSVLVMAVGFLIAEILGVVEELVDSR